MLKKLSNTLFESSQVRRTRKSDKRRATWALRQSGHNDSSRVLFNSLDMTQRKKTDIALNVILIEYRNMDPENLVNVFSNLGDQWIK